MALIGEYYIQKVWHYLFEYKDNKCIPLKNTELLKKLATLILIETSKNNDSVSKNIIMNVITKKGAKFIEKEEIDALKKEIKPITNDSALIKMLRERKK